MVKGKVYIMGVGPGDYRLLTLKAAECIARADVIVYDRLVSDRILSFAKEDAEFIYVGKMPDCHAVPQDGINDILVTKALEGKTVARVKGGDPFMFGRGGEEAEKLYENGIEFEIVPGVTSAIAVPAYAGIPVTHRDFCSSLHIITGHEKPEKESSSINYSELARIEGTLVFLMGVKNLADISANLIKHGKNENTPAAVIEKGTTSHQRKVIGTLKDIAGKIAQAGVKSPAVTVIGDVVALEEKLSWFPAGKLAGKKVVVTRAREQASALAAKIEEWGAEVIEFPTIKIGPPEDFSLFDNTLDDIKCYDWIAFTSVNGVKAFFERMNKRKIDTRSLYGIKTCAVGVATGQELNRHGLMVDYVPREFTTQYLLEGLLSIIKPSDRILLARADIANPELSEGLKKNGNQVTDLVVYKTMTDGRNSESVLRMLTQDSIDYITFTSSSTVRNFMALIGNEKLVNASKAKVVCIGPVTQQTAVECGLNVHAVAGEYTIDGLVQKLMELSEV